METKVAHRSHSRLEQVSLVRGFVLNPDILIGRRSGFTLLPPCILGSVRRPFLKRSWPACAAPLCLGSLRRLPNDFRLSAYDLFHCPPSPTEYCLSFCTSTSGREQNVFSQFTASLTFFVRPQNTLAYSQNATFVGAEGISHCV